MAFKKAGSSSYKKVTSYARSRGPIGSPWTGSFSSLIGSFLAFDPSIDFIGDSSGSCINSTCFTNLAGSKNDFLQIAQEYDFFMLIL